MTGFLQRSTLVKGAWKSANKLRNRFARSLLVVPSTQIDHQIYSGAAQKIKQFDATMNELDESEQTKLRSKPSNTPQLATKHSYLIKKIK